MPLTKTQRYWPRRSPSSSASAASPETTPISRFGSMLSVGTVRRARVTPARWQSAGRRSLHPPPLPPPKKGEANTASAPSSRWPTPSASLRTAAARRADSSWSTAAARKSIQPLRSRAKPTSPWPNSPAAPLPAASFSRRQSHCPRSRRGSPTESPRATRFHSIRQMRACACAGCGGSVRSPSPSSRCR